MLKQPIKYIDFNGEEREENFYFYISQPELVDMNLKGEGLDEKIRNIINAKDTGKLITMFKELILKAYGEKSEDGRVFEKSEEISRKFSRTAAYEKLYNTLTTDADTAAKFIKAILPSDLMDKIPDLK